MARMSKGAKRYLLFRGKDENEQDILIDVFGKKELREALKKARLSNEDYVVKVEVLGKVEPNKV
jgi:hypothetical protein